MQMCDGCVDLEGTGEQQACVAACPQRALEFGDVEELRAKHGDAVRGGFEPLVDPAITQPSLLVTPHRNAKIPVRSEEHTSELQSLMRISYAVFCLNKKNNTITT